MVGQFTVTGGSVAVQMDTVGSVTVAVRAGRVTVGGVTVTVMVEGMVVTAGIARTVVRLVRARMKESVGFMVVVGAGRVVGLERGSV